MASFIPPIIQDNPNGWGPSSVPEKFKDMPYQPFSKGDRLGKISDWTGNTYQDRRYQNKYASAYGAGSQYSYYHEEDESTFQLVDTTKTQRPLYQRGRLKYNQQRQQRERRAALNASKVEVLSKSQKSRERDRQRQLRKWQKNYGRNIHDNRRQQQQSKTREASVTVHPSWAVLEEMDFARLSKLNMNKVEDPKDLIACGALEYYDRSYDRVNSKTEKKLKRINRIFHTVTTTDDPVIRKLSRTSGTVYGTDTIITTLMCCTRSVYPWDIVVQRVGNKLFFDKREDSDFDILSVSETATEPPQEEGNSINSPKNLSMEATYVNHNFTQQVLKATEGGKYEFNHPNPFYKEGDGEVASVAYRYRMFDLGNDIELVVRCEHDAVVMGPNGEPQFMTVKTFNEWDSKFSGGVDWRTKIDNQRGAVLATELKNNSFKLARWTSSALLAGSDIIKFGFVSRMNFRDSRKHTILGTQQFKPMEFATQMNLNMENAWAILRCIIDICMKLDEGKYLIMKDPNKQVIRIYDIPDDTFEDEESDSSEEDSEEGDEDEEDQE